MRKIILSFVFITVILSSFSLYSQINNEPEAIGLPGDNLNLYAVLDIFQKSKTLEEFEKFINKKETDINNLDLNNDNRVDYISVFSYNEGHFHSIVLRVAISSDEYQDVAVIEVSKNNSGKVIIQVIGDEALYGEDYVIEPSNGAAVSGTSNPGYIGNNYANDNLYDNNVVYVNNWSIIAYLYSPSFSVYISPWYWGYYPFYWHPWLAVRYYSYWRLHNHYYSSPLYHRTVYVRYPVHYSYYLKRRNTSTTVSRNRRSGSYNNTYEGRTYKRTIPNRRTTSPVDRSARQDTRYRTPSTQQRSTAPARTTTPTRRQESPSARSSDRTNNRQTPQSRR